MADNYTANAGTGGDTFAADDVSGVKFARVKVVCGSDGVAQDNWTPFRLISAASTNATSVKASAGSVGFIHATNLNAAARFLKLYNKASAPTVGTDTPIATLVIPGNTAGAGFVLPITGGVFFSTGIAYAVTGAYADADTTAVAAGEVFIFGGYA